jgi:hypothetical protein
MIVQNWRYFRTHVVGGGGIFDTIAKIVKRITGNNVGDLASKLLVSAASEAGKRLASRFIAAPPPLTGLTLPSSSAPAVTASQAAQQVGPPITGLTSWTLQNAVSHQAKLNEIMSKYTGSGFTPMQQSAITIQDLVRTMHQGSGLKVI